MPGSHVDTIAAAGKMAILRSRNARLQRALEEAEKLPAKYGEAKARKDALLARIEAAKAVVQREAELRNRYRQLTAESALDKDPGFFSMPGKQSAHRAREKPRAQERKAIKEELKQLAKKNQALYGENDVASPCLTCHEASVTDEVKRINKLARVEFLNGKNDADPEGFADPILTKLANQWVNLAAYRDRFDRDKAAMPAWLASFDGEPVESFDRLSRRVRVIVEFEQPGVEQFWIKLIPGGGNLEYSATEVAYKSYRPSPADAHNKPIWYKGTTNDRGKAIVEVEVRAAAGDTWKVQGKDSYDTTKNGAGSLKAVRGLFVTTMTMDKVLAVGIADAKAEWRRHLVFLETAELTYDPTEGKVPYQRFLYADDRFSAQVRAIKDKVTSVFDQATFKGCAVSVFEPYLVSTLFYDMSPKPVDGELVRAAGPPATSTKLTLNGFLWDPKDPSVDWFKSAEIEVETAEGVKAKHNVPKDQFELIGNEEDGYKGMKLKADAVLGGVKVADAKSCTMHIKFRYINGGVNGFSSGEQGNGSFIAICRRHTYKNRDEAEMNQTIVHELGHKINFTTGPEPATATPKQPNQSPANHSRYRWLDASALHYSGRKHQGGHCFYDAIPTPAKVAKGAPPPPPQPAATSHQPDFSVYQGLCVMFGAGNSRRKIEFCPTCTDKLKRIDLETGWKGIG